MNKNFTQETVDSWGTPCSRTSYKMWHLDFRLKWSFLWKAWRQTALCQITVDTHDVGLHSHLVWSGLCNRWSVCLFRPLCQSSRSAVVLPETIGRRRAPLPRLKSSPQYAWAQPSFPWTSSSGQLILRCEHHHRRAVSAFAPLTT